MAGNLDGTGQPTPTTRGTYNANTPTTPTVGGIRQSTTNYTQDDINSWYGRNKPYYSPGVPVAYAGPKLSDVIQPDPKFLSILNQLKAQNAPLFDLYAQQLSGDPSNQNSFAYQQAQLEAAIGARGGAAARGAELANQEIDLDLEKLGIDRASLQRQLPYLDELFGYREGARGSQREYLSKLKGFNNDQFGLTMTGLGYQRDRATRDVYSNAAVSGSVASLGTREGLSDVGKDYELGSKTAMLQRDQTEAGIKAQWDDNYWSGLMDSAKTKEDKLAVGDQLKTLDILERQYGLKREQIANSLASTLADLNLNKVTSVNQILQMAQSTNEKQAALAISLIQQAVEKAGTLSGAASVPTN